MAVLVINALEVVDVDEHTYERSPASTPAGQFLTQAPFEKTPIRDTRQRIRQTIELEPFTIDHVVDTERTDCCQVLEEVRRRVRVVVCRVTATLIECPDKLAAKGQRHQGHRSQMMGTAWE